ncbi:MAG: amidohydrolase family protein, partial [Kiritimatiellae bacterium]|nr:amidohydrolase family protein [Kiritimatiellia bacterium]
HLQHLSCAESVRLVSEAKKGGDCRISCEATPHHLLLAAEDIPGDDASWKMNPPLGLRADRDALRNAVLDGTICAFATDHAPHAAEAKARGFAAAPFGCIGLETALAATWKAMVEESGMRPVDWAARWTSGPAAVLGLAPPSLAPGARAKLALLSLERHTPSEAGLKSKSRNCPFLGIEMPVRVEALLA